MTAINITKNLKKGKSKNQTKLSKIYTSILNVEDIEEIKKLAYESNIKGIDQGHIIEKISEKFAHVNANEVQNIIYQIYEENKALHNYDKLHVFSKIELFLKTNYPTIRRNLLTGNVEINNEVLSETDLNTILIEANVNGVKISTTLFYIFLDSNFIPSYNPIHDFFEKNIPNYSNPSGYIQKLAQSIESNTGLDNDYFFPQYVVHFTTKWLVGIVASAFGHFNDLYHVLTGGQGSGKTEFYRRLLPPELKRFFAETKLDELEEADIGMKMCEYLMVFDDEMSGKSKKDWRRIKSLLSQDNFTVRRPYKRGMENLKRLASFCGTCNELELLGDTTGNRRMIPIEVQSINHELYNSIDKKALWMEVYYLYMNGYNWRLDKDDIQKLNQNTTKFQITDRDTELLLKYLEVPKEDSSVYKELSATEITEYIQYFSRITIHPISMGIRLTRLGFQQKTHKVGNTTIRKYKVIKLMDMTTC